VHLDDLVHLVHPLHLEVPEDLGILELLEVLANLGNPKLLVDLVNQWILVNPEVLLLLDGPVDPVGLEIL